MKWYYILAIVTTIIILIGLLIVIVSNKAKGNNIANEYPELLVALGGKDNINEVTFKGSRVSVILLDKTIVDKERIKSQGVETIVVSNKKLTMVVGKQSEVIFKYLNNQINI